MKFLVHRHPPACFFGSSIAQFDYSLFFIKYCLYLFNLFRSRRTLNTIFGNTGAAIFSSKFLSCREMSRYFPSHARTRLISTVKIVNIIFDVIIHSYITKNMNENMFTIFTVEISLVLA